MSYGFSLLHGSFVVIFGFLTITQCGLMSTTVVRVASKKLLSTHRVELASLSRYVNSNQWLL